MWGCQFINPADRISKISVHPTTSDFPSTYLTLNGGADEESKGVGPRQEAVLFPPPGHDQRHVEPHDERHQRRGAAAGRAKLTHPLEQPATNTLGEYRCLELCVR